LSYVIFFAVLLVVIGLLYRQTLKFEMEGDVRAALEEEWGAAKGYVRIDNFQPVWTADRTDPEEAYIVSRLQHVFFIADANGNAVDYSATYQSIGFDSPEDIQRVLNSPEPEVHIRWDKDGVPYLIKAGVIPDEHKHRYFFAIGRSL
ncbi:MAG: hypothetical protein DMG59_28600, partial [Acidobacteria bacterium]